MLGATNSSWYPAFKLLIDTLCYPMRLFDERGRTGGVVALVLGAGMIYGGWQVTLSTSLLGLGVSAVGLAYCFYGVSRLVGQEARLRRMYGADAPIPEPLPKQELIATLESRKLPFCVCTRCRIVMNPWDCGGRCPSCGSDTDCLTIEAEDDRRTAISSVY